MRRTRGVATVALCLALAGCSESTMIRSYPPGAKLYVNNQFEGVTPYELTVPRSEFADHDFKVRLERDGYATTEETLRKRICPGRIVGGVFTLGIVLIFKRPTCFDSPQDISMMAQGQAASGETPAPHQPTVEERLERIQHMREQGTITNEEYEHYRHEILKGL